ncbi:MAG: hypothetical protein JNK04_25060 [Myxococcales bacterium]|nr:hypothetical protein [Myxococcales bacterium]
MAIEPFKTRLKDPTHVVIEMFGGDNNLSPFVSEDLEEVRRGNQGNFAMLALCDRSQRKAEVLEVSNGRRTRVEALGEIDTGDPEELRHFLARALVTYKSAPHIAVGFWDHGSGVFDEKDDDENILKRRPLHSRPAHTLLNTRSPARATGGRRAMLHDDTGGLLTTREAGAMLASAFKLAGRSKNVDVIFSDTCLNGMLEVTHELGSLTDIVVASEELEPGDGWDYYQLFRLMTAAPPATAAEWAKQMITAFHIGYADRPDQHPCTLAAFATKNEMVASFGKLVDALSAAGKPAYREALEARMNTQTFTGEDRYDTFDLHHFATTLASVTDVADVKKACVSLAGAAEKACIAETKLGEAVENAKGIAFWFPTSKASFKKDRETYDALSCSKKTGWVEYLSKMMG